MKLFYDIENYLQGTTSKILDNTFLDKKPKYIVEQIYWRMSKCKPCLDNGKCLECGCKTPDMFYSAKKLDAKKKWMEFMTEDDWTSFKAGGYVNFLPLYVDVEDCTVRVEIDSYYDDKNTFINFKKYTPLRICRQDPYTEIMQFTEEDIKDIVSRQNYIDSILKDLEPAQDEISEAVIKDSIVNLGDIQKGLVGKCDVILTSLVDGLYIKNITLPCTCSKIVFKDDEVLNKNEDTVLHCEIDTKKLTKGSSVKTFIVEIGNENSNLKQSLMFTIILNIV